MWPEWSDLNAPPSSLECVCMSTCDTRPEFPSKGSSFNRQESLVQQPECGPSLASPQKGAGEYFDKNTYLCLFNIKSLKTTVWESPKERLRKLIKLMLNFCFVAGSFFMWILIFFFKGLLIIAQDDIREVKSPPDLMKSSRSVDSLARSLLWNSFPQQNVKSIQ